MCLPCVGHGTRLDLTPALQQSFPISRKQTSGVPDVTAPPRTVSKPHGHPADGLTMHVQIGDGAFINAADPRSYDDGGLVWQLTYGNVEKIRYTAAAVVRDYSYLLSGHITTKEATRQLRILRKAFAEAMAEARSQKSN